MSFRKVSVLGGGLAGLSAAYLLTKNEIDTLVVEKKNDLGGLARTITKNDFRFDIGGHRFFSKNEELNQLIDNLLHDDIVNVDRISRIFWREKFIDYPLTAMNLFKFLDVVDFLSIPASYLFDRTKYLLLNKGTPTLEHWMKCSFGTSLFNRFFKPYTERVWGIPCSTISDDWAVQRIKKMSVRAVIQNLIYRNQRKIDKSLIRKFIYFRKGFGQLPDAFAKEVETVNTIMRGSCVKRLMTSKNRISAIDVEKNGLVHHIVSEEFISSIPVTLLVQLMDPRPPSAVLDAARKLGYRDLITIQLMLDKEQVSPDHWVYIHDSHIPFARLHEPKNWSREMAPEGKTSLVVEYFCFENDPVWLEPDKTLIERTVTALSDKLGFMKRSELIDGFVLRHRKAYPVYKIGYKEHLDLIYSYLSQFENLQIIGRNGMFRYNNADHSIETGLMAASNILGGDQNIFNVNADQEYHEQKVVKY